MYYLILGLLSFIWFIFLKKKLYSFLVSIDNEIKQSQNTYNQLLKENTELKNKNSNLKEISEEMIALFEITRNICGSLDKERIFNSFKEELARYIKIGEYRFVQEQSRDLEKSGFGIMPLRIERRILGYLVYKDIPQDKKDKFFVLAHQFLLGLKRAHLYSQLQELAITDSLTKVFSRRFFMERFNEEIERSRKFNLNFSFLMIDIDHFKYFNDNYGHLVGDAILKEIAKILKENIRQIDIIGRYGGEEFSLILIETDKPQAEFAAERIRKTISDKTIKIYDEQLKLTVSIGVATFPIDGKDAKTILDNADKALYKAKIMGRNRICIWKPD
ncbi:MAG: GGDEF domain-containing protein [Candidatus Omnitrophica bacterium]|nr:GGDEF domain-containing protein [Candidatus Omnitrophota bacterium]